MNKRITDIIKCLETAYTAACLADDDEAMDRISRAIIVLKTPADVNVFSDDFVRDYFKDVWEG